MMTAPELIELYKIKVTSALWNPHATQNQVICTVEIECEIAGHTVHCTVRLSRAQGHVLYGREKSDYEFTDESHREWWIGNAGNDAIHAFVGPADRDTVYAELEAAICLAVTRFDSATVAWKFNA